MTKQFRRRFWTAAAVICAAGAVWFAVSLVKTLAGYRKGDEDIQKIYALMADSAETAGSAVGTIGEDMEGGAAEDAGGADGASAQGKGLSEEDRMRLAAYRALQEQNGDVVGWIRIDGTEIDYPVMQTPEEPDYYLHRSFEGEESSYGMIYLDGRCVIGESRNYMIYGHHMRNGSMFAALEEYKSEEFWKQHPTIHFDTLDELGEYEVIGVIRIPAGEIGEDFLKLLRAGDEEEYLAFIDYVKENGYYDTGVEAEWPRQLITLTTCEYMVRNGRLLVVAGKNMEINGANAAP